MNFYCIDIFKNGRYVNSQCIECTLKEVQARMLALQKQGYAVEAYETAFPNEEDWEIRAEARVS